ncbi:MAG: type III pantothenate kinase [Muribaculaceae bacterium]|nr:type III pantothenate kinase [Muribaculaceae bacterium]
MALKLTIDQGNTAAKAAVWEDDRIVAEAVYRRLTGADIDRLADECGGGFDASIYSSVRDSDGEARDRMAARSKHFIELTADTPLPIKVAYATPATLGRDRIAAVVGAYGLVGGEWTLVVDCGTAITYDVLSPDGVFVGGNIAPGIFMRLEALNKFTARLPLVETSGECPRWGTDTETALRSGAISGVVAELRYYRSLLPVPEPRVVLTGGSADLVSERAGFDLLVDNELVSKGLNSILNYNEDI